MTRSSHRNAFTLVELVVVMGIIVLLVGLTLAVSTNVVEKAEVRTTENVMQVLDAALGEWEVTADRKLTWGLDDTPNGAAYDIQETWPHVLVLPTVLDTLMRTPAVKGMISKIDPDYVYRFDPNNPDVAMPRWISSPSDEDPDPNASDAESIYTQGEFDNGRRLTGMITVLDAWGVPLRVIHPGRVSNPNAPFNDDPDEADVDGTIFVGGAAGHELRYGTALSRRICFVSAGPDKKFGDISQPTDSDLYDDTTDNIYSYEVIKP